MNADQKTSVFISHNNKDKDAAREIGLFLTSENINVWFDEWVISAGESIIGQVSRGLEECTHFIILWSKNSAESNWVKRELSSIISSSIEKNGMPKIIPITLDETKLPMLLNDIFYIDYNGGTEEDRAKIIKTITGDLPSFNYIKAIIKKYHEVIYEDSSDDPLPFKACPICGSSNLKWNMVTDYSGDEDYYIVNCLDCKWGEWTQ